MTTFEIDKLIGQGEGISVEFKEAKEKVPATFYDTVVSFANTNGGIILLGVDDDGNVKGINRENKVNYLKNITTALNSNDKINPVLYLNPTVIDYEGKMIIAVQVPASSQVHDHAGRVYIREYEVDLDVTGNQYKMRGLFLKKGDIYTESHIYPGLQMSDLDESLFQKARNWIRIKKHDHPWLEVDNMQMLREAVLYWRDYEQNKEGFTLAAALLFGKDLTIQNLLPAYKVEAMVRIKNKDRYDDRLTLRTNLIDTYLQLNEFIYRHLPDKFFMEGDQCVDLRDRIFREVISNIIIHREYTDATATELLIEEDAVRTLNPNIPRFNGIMDLDNFSPHPKNPNLRRFFMAMGWADEIGSGIRNTKKYLPFYVEHAKPVFIDEPIFRTVIPLVRYSMADFTNEWFAWFGLNEKWLPKMSESLKNIEIDGRLQKLNWKEKIEYLVPNWIDKVTKLDKKVTKPGKSYHSYIQNNDNNDQPNPNEKLTKLTPSLYESSTMLPSKKLWYVITILMMSGTSVSIDDLTEILSFKHKTFFRENYLKPLEAKGMITKTNPEKPTDPNQKYVITEKGKRFLTGQDV